MLGWKLITVVFINIAPNIFVIEKSRIGRKCFII